jgi:hypothetical protein
MYTSETTEYTDEQKGLITLVNKCKSIQVFEYEGEMCLGSLIDACKDFVKNNPNPADFHVWLQDHYERLTPTA